MLLQELYSGFTGEVDDLPSSGGFAVIIFVAVASMPPSQTG